MSNMFYKYTTLDEFIESIRSEGVARQYAKDLELSYKLRCYCGNTYRITGPSIEEIEETIKTIANSQSSRVVDLKEAYSEVSELLLVTNRKIAMKCNSMGINSSELTNKYNR